MAGIMRAPNQNLSYEKFAEEAAAFQTQQYEKQVKRLTARKATQLEIERQQAKIKRFPSGPKTIFAASRRPTIGFGLGGSKTIRKTGITPSIFTGSITQPGTITKATKVAKAPSYTIIGRGGAKTIIGRQRVASAYGVTEKDITKANIELTALSESSMKTLGEIDVREYKAAIKKKPLPFGKTAEEYSTQLSAFVEQHGDVLTRTPEHYAEVEQILSPDIKLTAEQLSVDAATRAKLKDFKYYGGVGFAKGKFAWSGSARLSEQGREGKLPSEISYLEGMSGGGGVWYPTGEYEIYKPDTGKITKYKAIPQSLRKVPNIQYDGKTYAIEEFRSLVPTQKNEVIGQQFDYSKYKNNPTYTIERGPQGKIKKIYSTSSGAGVGDYKAEEIFVTDGKVTKIIKRDTYTKKKQAGPNVRGVFDAEIINYDNYGLLKKVSYADDKNIDKDTSSVVQTKVKNYRDGMLESQLFNTYSKGRLSYSRLTDYGAGTTTRETSAGDREITNIGKTIFPTENIDIIRKSVPLSKVSLSESYAPAKMLTELPGIEEKQIYNYKTKKYEKFNPNKQYGSRANQYKYSGEFNRKAMERLGFGPSFKTKTIKKGYRAAGLEQQRMISIGSTTGAGNIITYQTPSFAAPTVLGTDEALFKSTPSKYKYLESKIFISKPSAAKVAAAKTKLAKDVEKKYLESIKKTKVVLWDPTSTKFLKVTRGGDVFGVKGQKDKGFTMFDKPMKYQEYTKRAIGYYDLDKRAAARMYASSGFLPEDVSKMRTQARAAGYSDPAIINILTGYSDITGTHQKINPRLQEGQRLQDWVGLLHRTKRSKVITQKERKSPALRSSNPLSTLYIGNGKNTKKGSRSIQNLIMGKNIIDSIVGNGKSKKKQSWSYL